MTTARAMVADQIRADHPKWDVRSWGYVPANVTTSKPVVAVMRTDLTPGTTSLTLRHDLQVNLYGAKTAGADVEDELDALLDEVLLSLQRIDHYTWSAAARTVWGQLSGWQITGHTEPDNPYPSIIREERS